VPDVGSGGRFCGWHSLPPDDDVDPDDDEEDPEVEPEDVDDPEDGEPDVEPPDGEPATLPEQATAPRETARAAKEIGLVIPSNPLARARLGEL
jgi:hypothetical protein